MFQSKLLNFWTFELLKLLSWFPLFSVPSLRANIANLLGDMSGHAGGQGPGKIRSHLWWEFPCRRGQFLSCQVDKDPAESEVQLLRKKRIRIIKQKTSLGGKEKFHAYSKLCISGSYIDCTVTPFFGRSSKGSMSCGTQEWIPAPLSVTLEASIKPTEARNLASSIIIRH